ncbi:High-affinity branched-chain amino acid transport system permease protein LivH (TC 3.A.1.4.1) [hydrothermal vent metagenome]|uniref:High-affinity branched-chain amino acid transport system permease protein LivH (TC 3.A.1.4.1) n=1 Tax=hydrothermal vent metagenome TaxID=652676 RepID=A0A3B0T3B8_9ZZZZ
MLSVPLIAQVGGTSLETFITKTIDGLALGAIYALLALGFVIIFKATQVLTFAHGAVSAMGAYLVSYFAVTLNVPGRWMGDLPVTLQFALSAVLAVLLAAAIGMALERVFIRPMIGEPLFSIVMITIGLDIVIRTIVGDYIGQGNTVSTGAPWGFLSQWRIGGVIIQHAQVATIIVAVITVAVLMWFFKTRIGIAMRATAFDQEAAMAQGISAGKIFALAWGIGAALAVIGGIFAAVPPRALGVSAGTAFFALRAFPAIVIGGLDSIKGAVVGGFIVGMAEVMAGHYLSSVTALGIGFNTVVPYLVMMAVLLVRPHGLYGTVEIRRV